MAKSAPFFPFYVDDWLEDEAIFDMGLECEGAYIRLLSAMWKRGGFVPDKANWCCNILRCKPAKWKKIRSVLLDLEVIKVKENSLFNERLAKEFQLFKEKCGKNEENANKRWKNMDQVDTKKVNEINETNNAVALRSECHTDTDTDTDTDTEKELNNTLSRSSEFDLVDNFSKPVDNSKSETQISQAIEILDFMNEKLNRNLRAKSPNGKKTANAEIIIKLLKAGYTVSNLRQVVARKKRDWDNSDMEKYLRPETLFRKSKFEGYLAECVLPKKPENDFDDFEDFDDLEKSNSADIFDDESGTDEP